MDIIACPINADWDAVGAMLAARRLYPGATLVAPEPQDRLMASAEDVAFLRTLPLRRTAEIDISQIRKLIVVGARLVEELGDLARATYAAPAELHVFDHRENVADNLNATLTTVQPAATLVTTLVHLIQERDLKLTAAESTWALLGLFEKTNFLTTPSTTAADCRAAALLMDWGADRQVAAEALQHRFDPAEVMLYYDLTHAAMRWRFGPADVLLTEADAPPAVAKWERCLDRLHRLSGTATTLALIKQEERTHLLGRSTADGIDLSRLAAALGGEAAPTTASITFADRPAASLRRTLRKLLPTLAPPIVRAADLMNHQPVTLAETITLADALAALSRAGIGDAVVLSGDGRVVGWIDLPTVLRAVRHELGPWTLGDLSLAPPPFCRPDDDLAALIAVATATDSPLLCALDGVRLAGIVRREEILRRAALASAKTDETAAPLSTGPSRNRLARDLTQAFKGRAIEALRTLSRLAQEAGVAAYLVGGCVRDLLLHRPTTDLDVVVEGDAPALANGLSAALGVPVTTFEVFQTATLNVNDHHIDLAMARREHYPRPGALPVVEAASVRDDIERRDFTINTLLVDLRPERFGELVDWKDGLADLRSGLVRVLHPLSFAEDPTRLFRAVRLACRFGFELDDRTAALFRTAVSRGHVETVKPRRIWKELERMLVEPAAAAMVERLFQTGLARALLDRWTAPDTLPRHLRAAGEMRERPQLWPALKDADWAVAWLALATAHLADVDFGALAARLGLPDGMAAKTRDASQRALELSRQLPRLAHAPASEAAAAVRTAPPEAAIVAIVTSEFPETPQLFHRYFRDWMHVKPHVTGDDLQRLGLEPGPLYRETLDRVRDAQLDGLVQTKDDALALVRKIWKEKTKETKPR